MYVCVCEHEHLCACLCTCVCVRPCVHFLHVCIIMFLCVTGAVWREAEDRTGAVAEQDSNGEGGRWLGAAGRVCPQQ